MNKKRILSERLLKYLVGLSASFFLFYSLFTFNGYGELFAFFAQRNVADFYPFFFVLAFIPLNWFLESVKWQLLLKNTEPISIHTAIYSVLTGLTTAVLSPARIGEFAGRLLVLKPENRKKAVVLWAIGGMTMTIVILLLGIPAAFLYFRFDNNIEFLSGYSTLSYLAILLLFVIGLLIVYFSLPFMQKYRIGKFTRYFSFIFKPLETVSSEQLLKVLLLSTIRYFVFCLQFGFMLHFFGINLSFYETSVGILTAYLIVTGLPSVFFTEAIVRSSVFILVLGIFTPNVAGIAATSMLLWILNVAVPTFAGVLLLYRKPLSYQQKKLWV